MATIKSYTDIEQSKELAEILPLESADMSWVSNGLGKPFARTIPIKGDPEELCACWSLAALLQLIADKNCIWLGTDDVSAWRCVFNLGKGEHYETTEYTTPIDACVELIVNSLTYSHT